MIESTGVKTTVCYLDFAREKRNTAGMKAPEDIARICAGQGWKRVVLPAFPKEKNLIYQRLWLLTVCPLSWLRLAKQIPRGATLIYQHPMYGKPIVRRMLPWLKRKRDLKVIAVVHDLESLRGGIAGVVKQRKHMDRIVDNELLKELDAVICHNAHMRAYLEQQGFDPKKLVELGIFDYLSDCERIQPEKGASPSVAIAGNLAYTKSAYLYEVFSGGANANLTMHLYGNRFEPERAVGGMVHHGSFPPEALPAALEGDFGLVWDGLSAETCAGNTGNYLRYNNPHKTSLYLSSGMPVVVWSEAAIADFVRSHRVGITVSDLKDLSRAIEAVTPQEYRELCENTARVGAELRRGAFFLAASERALRICGAEQTTNS